jgi:hypothetical protein
MTPNAPHTPESEMGARTPDAVETLHRILDVLHVSREMPLDELPHLVTLRCRPISRRQLHDLVQGSLQCALAEHGAITCDSLPEAVERTACAIHAVLRAQQVGRAL